jgi:hypothetical protein
MYTSVVLFALAGSIPQTDRIPESTLWKSDYGQALKEGSRQKKPLAVFIGQGPAGWDALSRDGRLTPAARQLLEAHYVCVYLDTDKLEGRRLAESFEIKDGPGLVISDQSGESQAFHHEGDLPDRDLERNLRKFADPNRVVTWTETQTREETRYYPSFQSAPTYYPYVPVSIGRGC